MSRTGVGLLLLTAVIGVVLALVAWNASGSPEVDQVVASVVRESAPVREQVTRTGRELVSTVDEEPETWPVLCEVTGGERLSGTVRLIDGDTELVGMLDDNELGLMSPVADFDGGFELDGYRFSSVSWDLGWDDVVDCRAVQIEWLGGHVTGQVTDDEGLPVAQARVRGCGDWQDADDAGRFALRTMDEACTLVAAWPQAAEGVPTASLDVEVGDDVLLVLEAPAIVTGHVRNSAGNPEPGALVAGCGVRGETDADGFYELVTHPRVCFVEAYRMDGAFMSRSGRSRVDLLEDDVEVDFVLDEYPTGGMGISLRVLPEGMYVRGVAPNGPADRAGIVAGELIAQIDDAPLAGMSQSEMVATGTGEIGATLELVVIGETGERRVTLDREWVELWL